MVWMCAEVAVFHKKMCNKTIKCWINHTKKLCWITLVCLKFLYLCQSLEKMLPMRGQSFRWKFISDSLMSATSAPTVVTRNSIVYLLQKHGYVYAITCISAVSQQGIQGGSLIYDQTVLWDTITGVFSIS